MSESVITELLGLGSDFFMSANHVPDIQYRCQLLHLKKMTNKNSDFGNVNTTYKSVSAFYLLGIEKKLPFI